jgi:CheY-like chemotaxis protein
MLDILRNAPETKDTKIIMMTALSQAEDKARAEKLGADMYLVKSQVTLEDVTKAVHSILDDPSESSQEADSAAAQEMVSSGSQDQSPKPEEQKPAEKPVETKVQEAPKEEPPKAPAEPPAQVPAEENKPENAPPTPVQEPPKTEEPPKAPAGPVAPEIPVEEPKPVSADTGQNQSSDNPTPITVNVSSDDDSPATNDSSAVTPSLAQALEDEEKAVHEKIEDFEKSEPEASAGNNAVKPSEQPTVQEQASTNNSPPESAKDQAKDEEGKANNLLDEKPAKKVIKPINDPTKGPDINDLVAKEEAKESAGGGGAAEANQVIKPNTSASQPDQSSTPPAEPHSDEFGKISL